MKKIIFVILAVFLFSSMALADYRPKVVDDEEIVLSGTTVYTFTRPSGCVSGILSVQGDSIRWKGQTDSTPTADNGNLLDEGDYLYLGSPYQIDEFKMILKDGGSGATVYIIYYGPDE